jgi:hypothetical protein
MPSTLETRFLFSKEQFMVFGPGNWGNGKIRGQLKQAQNCLFVQGDFFPSVRMFTLV